MTRVPAELIGVEVPLCPPSAAAKMGGRWFTQSYLTTTGIYHAWWCNICSTRLTRRFLRSSWPKGLMKRHRCVIRVEVA